MMTPRLPRLALPIVLFFAAAAFVVAVTWPLAQHAAGSCLAHWDPPFHAWKLDWMARRLLAGDFTFGGGDTNHLSPWSGTLYYEALQLPPAFLAAAAYALFPSLPPILVYNASLFVFWALGAPCWYFLARRLGCSHMASALGAFAFCALPWRVSYAPEFQMQLVFAVPLFLGALREFLCGFRARDAALAALAWWLLAVSELYEAVMFALAAVFIIVARLASASAIIRDRRLWRGVAAGCATGAVSLVAWLWPYFVQRGAGAVQRPLHEVRAHAAQPLSYLVPYGRFAPWSINAKENELSLWPTLCVIALAAAAAFVWWRTASLRRREEGGAVLLATRGPRIRSAVVTAARYGAAVSLAAFFAFAFAARPDWSGGYVAALYAASAVAVALSSLGLAMAAPPGETSRVAFLRGLAAASLFFLIMSCGPALTTGRAAVPLISNPVYLALRRGPLSILSGFRVMSRFGIIPLVGLLCAAGCGFDALFSRVRAGGLRAALATAAALLVAVEAFPLPGPVPALRDLPDLRASPAAARFVEAHPDCTVVDLPTGLNNRWSDAERKLSLVRDDWPCTWAWGGYFPPLAARLDAFSGKREWPWLQHELLAWHPLPALIVDKFPETVVGIGLESARNAWRPGWQSVVPANAVSAKELAGIARVVDEDDRFVFMELLPEPPQRLVRKLLRSSLVRRRPIAVALLRAAPGTAVKAGFNGTAVARGVMGPDGSLELRMDLGGGAPLEKTEPNTLTFRANGTNRFSIVSFDLLPR